LRDGTPVPLHAARMLACDSARIDVVVGEHGELLDVGRSTRTIPSAIGCALWLRDGGCRVPGCGRKQHLHAHHIQGWAEGGPTRLIPQFQHTAFWSAPCRRADPRPSPKPDRAIRLQPRTSPSRSAACTLGTSDSGLFGSNTKVVSEPFVHGEVDMVVIDLGV
jgi:hypothetical protein